MLAAFPHHVTSAESCSLGAGGSAVGVCSHAADDRRTFRLSLHVLNLDPVARLRLPVQTARGAPHPGVWMLLAS